MIRIVLSALAFLLAATSLAHAEPITIALFGAAFAATTAGAVVTWLITTAISIGIGLLKAALTKKPDMPQGVQFQIQMGDNNPIAFPVGGYATPGTRKYIGVWGKVGKTPNAYLTDVIQIADIPLPGQPGLWVNGKKCTILWGETPTDQGYPVEEFRVDGTDYFWARYNDGTQTVADALLAAKFGSDADRPWKSTMIGRGCPHLVLTARVNRDLFPGNMEYLIEPPVPRWYDLRKDSTAGGSGSHRWNDPTTWEATENPATIIYNIIRGIYYGDEWVFGGQNLPAFRLPASNWMAAMNECDAAVSLDAGGTEKQFRCGYMVDGDMEPLAVIEELKKACNGRIAEVGGIFKMLVGAPGSDVYSFSDGDVLVTKGQSFKPFPTLDETHNGIEATYPEPLEKWGTKDAPARYSDELEAADGQRRLATGVNFAAAPYPTQVQRLMLSMLLDDRRFRVHSFYLPPDAWMLEPNDVVSWASARNGYENKKFVVSQISGERTYNQLVVLKEIDPSDYDWDSSDELPTSHGPIGPIVAPTQAFAGWAVEQYTFKDADGADRRPGILVKADGDLDDVEFVRVQVRLAGTTTVLYDQVYPYGNPATNPDPLTIPIEFAGILPNTTYEARGLLEPYSGRDTEWSDWLSVTTPDVRLGPADLYPIDLDNLATEVQALLDGMSTDIAGNATAIADEVAARVAEIAARVAEIAAERADRIVDTGLMAGSLRDLVETVSRQSLLLDESVIAAARDKVSMRQEINVSFDGARAYSDTQLQLAVGPTSALAGQISALGVSLAGLDSDLDAAVTTLTEAIADSAAGEASARQALELQVRGSYAGTDLSMVTEGLIAQERQTRIAEDEALSASISLVSAGVGILFDWLIDWSFDTSVQGWTGNGSPTTSGGWLRAANHASDPYVVSPDDLAADGDAYKQIKMRVRKTGTPTWEGQFWWQGAADSTWDAGRRVTKAEPSYVDNIAVLTVDMTWTGTVDRIRVDLAAAQDGSNYFEIDWIDIGRPSPGASRAQVGAVQQALSTALAAEASDRETLSTILLGSADPDGGTELGDLTSGVVYQESQARSTADAAMASAITAIQSALTDAEDDIDALSTAQSTMQTSIDTLGDQVALNAADIDDVETSLAGKADSAVTDTLQSQIDALGGGNALALVAQAVRDLRITASQQALNTAGLYIGSQRQRNELAGAVANVQQAMSSRIDVTDGNVSVIGQAVTAIQLALPGLATLAITSALSGRVMATESGLTTQGSAITGIQAALAGYTGAGSVAGAFTSLDSSVSDLDGDVTALSSAMTSVQAAIGDISADANLQFEVSAGPAGYSARIGARARAGGAGSYRQAAWFLDVPPDTAARSRFVVVADQVVYADPDDLDTLAAPFLFEDGVLYLDEAKVRELDAANITVTGKFDAAEILLGGSVITDVLGPNAVSEFGNLTGTVSNPSHGSGSFYWTDIATETANLPSSRPILFPIMANLTIACTTSNQGTAACYRIINTSNGNNVVWQSTTVSQNGTGTKTVNFDGLLIVDRDTVTGDNIYKLQVGADRLNSNNALNTTGTADITLMWWKV